MFKNCLYLYFEKVKHFSSYLEKKKLNMFFLFFYTKAWDSLKSIFGLQIALKFNTLSISKATDKVFLQSTCGTGKMALYNTG